MPTPAEINTATCEAYEHRRLQADRLVERGYELRRVSVVRQRLPHQQLLQPVDAVREIREALDRGGDVWAPALLAEIAETLCMTRVLSAADEEVGP